MAKEDGLSALLENVRAKDAEIERLRALSQNNAHSWDAIVRERDALRAALDRACRWYEFHRGGSRSEYPDWYIDATRALAALGQTAQAKEEE